MRRSAYPEKRRKDYGKSHKRHITPEFAAHKARCSRQRKPCNLTEDAFLALLANGCDLCGSEAVRLYAGTPVCMACDAACMALGGQGVALVWARRVAAHRS